jgi:ABC-type antimicrobial peptide transport system permease subunit
MADRFALIVTAVLFFAVVSGLFFLAFAVGADPLDRDALFRIIFGAALFIAAAASDSILRLIMRAMAGASANETSHEEIDDSACNP